MTLHRYDADLADPLAELRIPVTRWYPVHAYIAAFDRDSPHRPTSDEAAMLASFIEQYKTCWCPSALWTRMDGEPFDVDPVRNTVVLHKYAPDDWGYRYRSWSVPRFAPPSPRTVNRLLGPWSLIDVLDYIHGGVATAQVWADWKAAHPDVFR